MDVENSIQQKPKFEQLALRINVNDTLDLLECPVCYEYMTPPIFQCREGHPICKDCTEKVKICPTCRGSFIDARCRILDRLAESLLEVRILKKMFIIRKEYDSYGVMFKHAFFSVRFRVVTLVTVA